MTTSPAAPFGRVLTAMVTPMTADGAVDLDGAQRLAAHLLEHGNDGLVLNGTTGESATTTDEEKVDLLRAVREAVGPDVPLISGVGTYDTAHSVHLAHAAAQAGATALLAVTPYYNKPPQAGVIAHFERIASSTDLPVMLYDIPGRTATALATETLVQLAQHPNIVAVKDAKADLEATAWVLARSELAVYSGDDSLTLPLLSIGASGVVGVATHVVGRDTQRMFEAFFSGDVAGAAALHRRLLHAYTGIFRTQGVILAKAALAMQGLPAGPVRLPLVDATDEQRAVLREDLTEAGVTLGEPA